MSSSHGQATEKKQLRNRTRLSCIQCHKRKQRCNRTLPCSNCMFRGAQDECMYEAPKATKRAKPAPPKKDAIHPRTGILGSDSPDSDATDIISSEEARSLHFFQDLPVRELRRASSWDEGIADQSGDLLKLASKFNNFLSPRRSRSSSSSSSILEVVYEGLDEEQSKTAIAGRSLNAGISGGRIDPFGSLPDLGMRIDDKLMHFYKVVTPYLSTLGGVEIDNPFNKFWMPRTHSSATLLSASIYAACVNIDGVRQVPFQRHTLASKSKTLQLVNQSLEESKGIVNDETICAVLVLMYIEASMGEIAAQLTHMRGLRDMVRSRGGLKYLGMNNLVSNLISTADRLSASFLEGEPQFPIPAEFHLDLDAHVPGPVNMDSPVSPHCRSFSASKRRKALHLNEQSAHILDVARSLIQSITKGDIENGSDIELTAFAEDCAAFLAFLLQLPPAINERSDIHREDLIYEAVRLAALVFTKALVERTPLSKTWDLSSLRELFIVLLRVGRNAFDHIPGVLLWIVMLAGPATQDVPIVRAWISSSTQRLGASMGFSDWRELIMSLENFLKYQKFLTVASPAVSVEIGEEEE